MADAFDSIAPAGIGSEGSDQYARCYGDGSVTLAVCKQNRERRCGRHDEVNQAILRGETDAARDSRRPIFPMPNPSLIQPPW